MTTITAPERTQVRNSKVPHETQEQIIALYGDGLSMRDISTRIHWCQDAVRNVLVLNGIDRNSKGRYKHPGLRFSADDVALWIELYQGGVSASDIAGRFGTQHSTVINRLRGAGVEIRARGYATRIRARARVARGGFGDHQRAALDLLERRGDVTTPEIARHVGASSHRVVYQVMPLLIRCGLVTNERARYRPRPYVWHRTTLSVSDVLYAELNPVIIRGNGDVMLPVGPFREWVNGLLATERRAAMYLAVTPEPHSNCDGSGGISVVGSVASAIGLSERRLRALMYEQESISLTTADRALQAYPGPVRLWDLWPELGDEEEAC